MNVYIGPALVPLHGPLLPLPGQLYILLVYLQYIILVDECVGPALVPLHGPLLPLPGQLYPHLGGEQLANQFKGTVARE